MSKCNNNNRHNIEIILKELKVNYQYLMLDSIILNQH